MSNHTSLRWLAGPVLFAMLTPSIDASEWPQWGGQRRNFSATASIELDGFPENGPRVIWKRPLGHGYSAVVMSGDRLVTMYRRDATDVVACLSRQTGKTLWEHDYEAPVPRDSHDVDTSYGEGPNSTPLIADGRVYTLSFSGIVHALDLEDGAVLWSRDLREDGVPIPYFGHSASPLRYRNTVIFMAGGAWAFDLETGESRWRNRSFGSTYASPLLADRQGGPVLVAAAAGEIVGVDPDDGELLWRHPFANQHRTILNSPLFGDDGRLFVSAYFLGSAVLKLSPDGRSIVKEWQTPRIQLSHTNAHRVGDWVYGFHRSVLTAVNVVTGEIGWRHRGLRKATSVRMGERFLLLDSEGGLSLASLTPEGPVVHDEARLFEGRAWTAPTVAGNVVYARDLERIVAIDLNRAGRVADRKRHGPPKRALQQPDFLTAKARLLRADMSGRPSELAGSRAAFERWIDDGEISHLAHYYMAYAAWREAEQVGNDRALELVDEAIEHLHGAVRRHKGFSDAHALLALLYPMYYRLDRQKAAVVGPMADEHLALALLFGPDNPRVALSEGLRLTQRPKDYGGDLHAGLRRVREALDMYAGERADPFGIDVDWLRARGWSWYGQALLNGTAEDRSRAADAFERALELEPEMADARELLAGLREDTASENER